MQRQLTRQQSKLSKHSESEATPEAAALPEKKKKPPVQPQDNQESVEVGKVSVCMVQ